MSRFPAQVTSWNVHSVKIQISLGIRAVWPGPWFSTRTIVVPLAIRRVSIKDSDQAERMRKLTESSISAHADVPFIGHRLIWSASKIVNYNKYTVTKTVHNATRKLRMLYYALQRRLVQFLASHRRTSIRPLGSIYLYPLIKFDAVMVYVTCFISHP